MSSMLESKIEERKLDKPVDREKTCPLLLRVFQSSGRHSNINDYRRGNVPMASSELQIYTWMDATLHEICSLVQEVNSESKRRGTVFEFSLVIPEINKPLPRMRDLGTVTVGQKGFDDGKTLSQCGFTIGDYLDIAIMSPQRPAQRRMRPYYSENKNF